MTLPYENKDGLRRDLSKLKYTGAIWFTAMKPHFKRFAKRPLPHEYTNLWVEGCRAEPYFFGHVLTIVSVIALVSALYNA